MQLILAIIGALAMLIAWASSSLVGSHQRPDHENREGSSRSESRDKNEGDNQRERQHLYYSTNSPTLPPDSGPAPGGSDKAEPLQQPVPAQPAPEAEKGGHRDGNSTALPTTLADAEIWARAQKETIKEKLAACQQAKRRCSYYEELFAIKRNDAQGDATRIEAYVTVLMLNYKKAEYAIPGKYVTTKVTEEKMRDLIKLHSKRLSHAQGDAQKFGELASRFFASARKAEEAKAKMEVALLETNRLLSDIRLARELTDLDGQMAQINDMLAAVRAIAKDIEELLRATDEFGIPDQGPDADSAFLKIMKK